MQNDDFFDDHHPTTATTDVGPMRASDPFAGFVDDDERPEDPLSQSEEPCITYKEWAFRIFWPVLAIIIAGAVFQDALAQFGLNLLLPIVVLYQMFAICKSTGQWFWQCRYWPIVQRRIESNYGGVGFVSLSWLLMWPFAYAFSLLHAVPGLGAIVVYNPSFVLLAALFPVIAQYIVGFLFGLKNKLVGSSLVDPYEIELAQYESRIAAAESKRVSASAREMISEANAHLDASGI